MRLFPSQRLQGAQLKQRSRGQLGQYMKGYTPAIAAAKTSRTSPTSRAMEPGPFAGSIWSNHTPLPAPALLPGRLVHAWGRAA
jgi:hypothetical protein